MPIKSKIKFTIIALLPTANDAYIANIVGCSREWVRQYRKKSGIENPFYRQKMCPVYDSEEMISKIISCINKNYTKRKICREIGIKHAPYLNTILKRNGIYYKKHERSSAKAI